MIILVICGFKGNRPCDDISLSVIAGGGGGMTVVTQKGSAIKRFQI